MDAAELLRRGREAWPDIEIPPGELTAYLGERDAPEERIADLYLACACARGDARAIELFEHSYFPDAASAISRVTIEAAIADEALQVLRTRLFVADGKRPAITGYAGRGDLRAWLRVAATRAALDLLRARRGSDGDSVLEHLPTGAADPAVALMQLTYGAEVRAAVTAAFATLDIRERNLLRQHFVDGLTIDALGPLYGVHRATAARWLERARASLEKHTRAALSASLGIGDETIDSIVRLVQSDLTVTLSGLRE